MICIWKRNLYRRLVCIENDVNQSYILLYQNFSSKYTFHTVVKACEEIFQKNVMKNYAMSIMNEFIFGASSRKEIQYLCSSVANFKIGAQLFSCRATKAQCCMCFVLTIEFRIEIDANVISHSPIAILWKRSTFPRRVSLLMLIYCNNM